ncbi:hypothetical protein M9434_001911 [Picochlorum sp. BPE23]|nr:hypothetical protein M9434_001911 [Picochlorum sp. BPE23]
MATEGKKKVLKTIGPVTVEVEPAREARDGKPSQSPVYRNKSGADGLPTTVRGLKTMYELFADAAKTFGERKCLGWRPLDAEGQAKEYTFYTYKETYDLAKTVAGALAHEGVKAGTKVGVWSVNCVEWMLAIRACDQMNATIVPMYDSLGETAIEYITKHSELEVAVIHKDKLGQFATICPAIKDTVRGIVCIGSDVKKEDMDAVRNHGMFVYTWDEFLNLGRENPLEKESPPSPEDIACIMYTSGTTGTPKGVLISHRAIVSGVAGAIDMIEQTNIHVSEKDSMLSYLPLAHIFDRLIEDFAIAIGASIGYWQGNVKKLMDDVAAFKPTLFMAVPRILERVCDGVEAKVAKASAIKQYMFRGGFSWKKFLLHNGVSHAISGFGVDATVFQQLKKALGGHVRFIVSGGAPLAAHVEDFGTVCLAPVLQGYGLTESCAASFVMLPDPRMAHSVGPPLRPMEFRLESVPELNYDATAHPPKGEILLRSPMLFSGYFKDEEKTKEVVDEDGWFHTGDIGTVTSQGCLRVIDRIKNVFKLSQGEYVAVEYIESVYSRNENVEQIWVYGTSTESFLVAVVVPKASWRADRNLDDQAVKTEMLQDLKKTATDAKLKGFEMIKNLHFETEEFSVENDLLTPTFKPKRPQLVNKYKQVIDDMYASMKKK